MILPMPLCDKHIQTVKDEFMPCPYCREKVVAFLKLPLVAMYLPHEVREAVNNFLKGADNGKSPA